MTQTLRTPCPSVPTLGGASYYSQGPKHRGDAQPGLAPRTTERSGFVPTGKRASPVTASGVVSRVRIPMGPLRASGSISPAGTTGKRRKVAPARSYQRQQDASTLERVEAPRNSQHQDSASATAESRLCGLGGLSLGIPARPVPVEVLVPGHGEKLPTYSLRASGKIRELAAGLSATGQVAPARSTVNRGKRALLPVAPPSPGVQQGAAGFSGG